MLNWWLSCCYGGDHVALPSLSSADDLEVTPLSSELMFVPEVRKYTVSEGKPSMVNAHGIY